MSFDCSFLTRRTAVNAPHCWSFWLYHTVFISNWTLLSRPGNVDLLIFPFRTSCLIMTRGLWIDLLDIHLATSKVGLSQYQTFTTRLSWPRESTVMISPQYVHKIWKQKYENVISQIHLCLLRVVANKLDSKYVEGINE